MLKYLFFNDYSEGAHPRLLERLSATNFVQADGYGYDVYSQQAAALLQAAAGNPQAGVYFLSGGTQTNRIALASMLKTYESVISASTGHINVHEAGAVEATGHKIHTLPSPDGKVKADQVQTLVDLHTDEHMVKPRAVYISNSTEVGTAYRKAELQALSRVCRQNGLYLYMDGARLGSALMSKDCDFTLPEMSAWVDMFYVGGTKNGALFGEALVINHPHLQTDFRFQLKQNGALLAKGRALGVQFLGLFEDGLYFELARHANAMAEKLSAGIEELGFTFLADSTTNQIFPIFPNALIAELEKWYGFYVWEKYNADHAAVRLVTSWATQEDKVDEFLKDLRELSARE